MHQEVDVLKRLVADLRTLSLADAGQLTLNREPVVIGDLLAQVQAALYRAVDMTVWVNRDFKTVLRYAKLARLMHTIKPGSGGGYVIRFDGPVSVLRHTRRYGVALAKFLPALIACKDWRMFARISSGRKGWTNALELSHRDGLKSHLPALGDFDSDLEKAFAEKWGEC